MSTMSSAHSREEFEFRRLFVPTWIIIYYWLVQKRLLVCHLETLLTQIQHRPLPLYTSKSILIGHFLIWERVTPHVTLFVTQFSSPPSWMTTPPNPAI